MANIVVKNESIIRYNDALSQKGLDALESRVFSDKVQCEGVGGMRFSTSWASPASGGRTMPRQCTP